MTEASVTPPRILSIAGSDSSGGAGIQADIKTITMLGGYAMTAVTAVTAQNSLGVTAIEPMPPALVRQQIEACVADIGVDAVKIGMLGSAQIVEQVAKALADITVPIVLDPVLVATSGDALGDDATLDAMRSSLFPLASVITPNLPELERLSGRSIQNLDAMREAVNEISRQFGLAVLAKGGHATDDRLTDLLIDPHGQHHEFSNQRIDTPHTHGTGCTLSSALATRLGHGDTLEIASEKAIAFTRASILAAPGFGSGHGPLGHQAVGKAG